MTPPGKSFVNSVRDAVGREKVVGVRNAHRELVRLPAPGQLLLNSARGPWVVQANGSRRPLGQYRMASWSPHGKFVAAVRNGYELVALEPNGKVHWEKPRKQGVASPRWSYEGYRIAYLSGDSLRVITGDGVKDWGLGVAHSHVAPAWRPATHEVAVVGIDGSVRVMDADKRTVLWTTPAGQLTKRGSVDAPRALTWSDDGALLLVRGHNSVRMFTPSGSLLGAAAAKPGDRGRVRTAFAPLRARRRTDRRDRQRRHASLREPPALHGDAPARGYRLGARRKLAARVGGRARISSFSCAGHTEADAVSNITMQFGAAARVDGWCCTS